MAAHQFVRSFAALPKIRESLIDLRDAMELLEAQASDPLQAVHRDCRVSARNLIHYLAMRRRDLRGMQAHLLNLGLSPLGCAEAAALPAVKSVLEAVDRILGNRPDGTLGEGTFDQSFGARRLEKHARELLGETPDGRSVRIMVTAPVETAWDYPRMHELLEGGMDCLRIDCGHDNPSTWLAIISNLKRARRALDRDCLLLMDLAGSRIKIGPIQDTPPVLKIRPQRDLYGRMIKPARVWITAVGAAGRRPASATDTLQVDASWLTSLEPGDAVRFLDTRGRRRRLEVIECLPGGVLAELKRTAYITNGTRLSRQGSRRHCAHKAEVVGIEAGKGRLHLRAGDELIVAFAFAAGAPAVVNSAGKVLQAARISSNSPGSLRKVKEGDRISIDDGQLAGVAVSVTGEGIRVRIDSAPPRGAKLTADMRLHFPDSMLDLAAITVQDAEHLEFISTHADLVALSSTHDEFDVQSLIEHLAAWPGRQPGIVIRIETRSAFERLPAILMSTMRHPRFGILVDRESLALECGHDRLAGIVEDIVRVCESAHCPTLWSTRTLESLIRNGVRSHAEMIDAAMNQRGHCLVLSQGPHVGEALRILVQNLKRLKTAPGREFATSTAPQAALDFGGLRRIGRRSTQPGVGIHRQRRSTIESSTTDTD